MQSILFFKIGAIGDTLMTTPLIRQLKSQWVRIGYFVGKRSAVILQGNPHIDELYTFDETIFEKKNIWNMIRMVGMIIQLRKLRIDYYFKTVVVLDRHWIFGLLTKIAGYKKRVGMDRLGKDGRFLTHKQYRDKEWREVEHYLNLGTFLGISPDLDDQSYDYHLTENSKVKELFARTNFYGKKKIAIALGWGNQISKSIHGAGDCRWWSLEHWTVFINRLLDAGYDVIAFGWPSDRKLPIEHRSYHDFTGKFSLKETIAAIRYTQVLICQESGFMHFGACAQTPVIALAWPTDPSRLFPHKTRTEKYPGEWIWKMSFECYDAYGSYEKCTGKEMDMINPDELYERTLSYLK